MIAWQIIEGDPGWFSFLGGAVGFLAGSYLEGRMIMYRLRLHRRRRRVNLRGLRAFRATISRGIKKGDVSGTVH
jgi:hypothetical protein